MPTSISQARRFLRCVVVPCLVCLLVLLQWHSTNEKKTTIVGTLKAHKLQESLLRESFQSTKERRLSQRSQKQQQRYIAQYKENKRLKKLNVTSSTKTTTNKTATKSLSALRLRQRQERMTALYQIKRTRPNTKVVFLVHIHKSAGTMLCGVAHHSNLTVNTAHNCNVQADQKCCGHDESVKAQREFAVSTPYDLVAAEMPLYEGMDYGSYDYVVILRNSRERYFSHWKHIVREAKPAKKAHKRGNATTGVFKYDSTRRNNHRKVWRLNDQTGKMERVERDPSFAEQLAKKVVRDATDKTNIDGQRMKQDLVDRQAQANKLKGAKRAQSSLEHQPEEEQHHERNPNPPRIALKKPKQPTEEEVNSNPLSDRSNSNTTNSGTTSTNSGADSYSNTEPKSTPNTTSTTTTKKRLKKPRPPPAHMMHPSQPNPIASRSHKPLVGTNFSQWWNLQPDNWNTRQLCGTHCHGTPKYQLTLKEWNYTLERVSKFHTVLFQEELQESVSLLAGRLNWTRSNLTQVQELITQEHQKKMKKKTSLRSLNRTPPKAKAPKPVPGRDQLDDWDPYMSALDDALYEIAHHWEEQKKKKEAVKAEGWKDLLTSGTRELLERYFEEEDSSNNHRRACTSECCAAFCSAW